MKIISNPKKIEPGESGEIAFSYDGRNKEGVQTGKIFVQLVNGEGNTKELDELNVRINLRPRVTLSPGLVVWQGSSEERTIELFVLDPALKLVDKITVNEAFQLKVEPDATNRKYRLRIKPLRKAEDWLVITFMGADKADRLERRIRLIAQ